MANHLKDKLHDLLLQATTDRSHFYVASVCREAIARIQTLDQALREARDMLKEIGLDHEHAPNLKHTRAFGEDYGWCDICSTRVPWGPGPEVEVIAKIDKVLGEGK